MTARQAKSLRRAVLRALYQADGLALSAEQLRRQVLADRGNLRDYANDHFDCELVFLAEQGYIAKYLADQKYHLEMVGITAVRSLIDLS